MKKLNLTLVLALVSLLSYGQVVQSPKDTAKSSVESPKPIRKPVDGTYEKKLTPQHTPAALPFVREDDVYWAKLIWRVIDLREKFNFPLYYPTEPKGNWKSLMQAILDAMDSTESNPNPLRVYDSEYVNVPKSIKELKASMGESKTIQLINPETFEYERDSTFFIAFGPKEVYRYEVKEQWRIDKQRSVMDQKIIAFNPMFWFEKDGGSGEDEGNAGNYGGEDENMGEEEDGTMPTMPNRRWRNFGWIYYPEVRPTFAVTEVFNPANSAQQRNYDDLFLQRRFSSFIKAEQNVHDNREINQYILNGMDQTLEAEKIKERIRVLEHDMWEF